MNCKVCKKTFTGIKCFKQHEASKKHLNKIKLLQILPLEDKKPLPKSFIYCSTCDMTFSEVQDFKKHSESFEHSEMLAKTSDKTIQNILHTDNLKNTSVEPKEKGQIQKITLFNVEHSSTIPNSVFKCDLCNKCFTGAIPYEQHLQSTIHKKKSTNSEYKDTHNPVNSCLICKICSKEFTGPVPYSIHMESKVHQEKEIESQKISRIKLMDTTNKWYCEICKKQCTGYIPYEQHLSSKVHFKNLNRNEVKVAPKSSQKQISEEESEINKGASTSADSIFNDKINSLDLDTDFLPINSKRNEVGEPPSSKRFKLFHSEAKYNSCVNEKKEAEKNPLQDLKFSPSPTLGSSLPAPERDRLPDFADYPFSTPAPERVPIFVPEEGPAPGEDPLPAPDDGPRPTLTGAILSIKRHLVPTPADLMDKGPQISVETKPTPEGTGSIYRISVGIPVRRSDILRDLEEESSSSSGCCSGSD